MTKTIRIVKKLETPFRDGSARANWWEAVNKHDGKTVEAFAKTVEKRPPHKTVKGQVEDPNGWLAFFKRQGLVALEGDDA